jgi:hypothetical protein
VEAHGPIPVRDEEAAGARGNMPSLPMMDVMNLLF